LSELNIGRPEALEGPAELYREPRKVFRTAEKPADDTSEKAAGKRPRPEPPGAIEVGNKCVDKQIDENRVHREHSADFIIGSAHRLRKS
jgi:hypothetical protein